MTVVIILAGGEGKRMHSETPKVLLNVGGLPMLVRILNTVEQFLLTDENGRILIVVGKHKSLIENVLVHWLKSDVISKITYVLQPEPKGTGHAVTYCFPYLNNTDKTLILSGDVPYISKNLMFKLSKYDVGENKIAIPVMNMENPHGYGRIIHLEDEKIKIVEERDCNVLEKKETKVNCGIYFGLAKTLKTQLSKLNNKNAQCEYYLTDLVNNIQVNICQISEENKHEVIGINTQIDLHNLEQIVNTK